MTRSERLTDTVQLQHKNITNPTISHADKVLAAILDCATFFFLDEKEVNPSPL